MAESLTATDIGDMLADMLTGAVGGTRDRWLDLIGPVKMLPIATHIHCNWSVSSIATGDDLAAINEAARLVREQHPYIIE
jgi:hypothetical protein